ncbi:hypothetical protein HDU93_000489, partial [Gonapodya sp. JEL0774]
DRTSRHASCLLPLPSSDLVVSCDRAGGVSVLSSRVTQGAIERSLRTHMSVFVGETVTRSVRVDAGTDRTLCIGADGCVDGGAIHYGHWTEDVSPPTRTIASDVNRKPNKSLELQRPQNVLMCTLLGSLLHLVPLSSETYNKLAAVSQALSAQPAIKPILGGDCLAYRMRARCGDGFVADGDLLNMWWGLTAKERDEVADTADKIWRAKQRNLGGSDVHLDGDWIDRALWELGDACGL